MACVVCSKELTRRYWEKHKKDLHHVPIFYASSIAEKSMDVYGPLIHGRTTSRVCFSAARFAEGMAISAAGLRSSACLLCAASAAVRPKGRAVRLRTAAASETGCLMKTRQSVQRQHRQIPYVCKHDERPDPRKVACAQSVRLPIYHTAQVRPLCSLLTPPACRRVRAGPAPHAIL